ncbi:MAG TPA: tail-specific protease [Bacteroidetes bacterium]|nr:tail-specific protease [Bacteroidota bacterium]
MRKSRIVFALTLIVLLGLFASYRLLRSPSDLTKEQLIMEVMMQGIQQQHYDPLKVDDDFSSKVYNLFLKRMDNNKKFFLQSDIDKLSKYKTDIDDEINNVSIEFFEKANSIYEDRFSEVKTFYSDLLAKPFNLKEDESIETDDDKTSYAKDMNALKEEWRKSLKYQVLIRVSSMIDDQKKAMEKSDTVKEKSLEQMEADARAKVLKSTKDAFDNLAELDRMDRFNLYLESMANVQDPHTEFFPPADKANFDIAMSGKLEGIGAQLQQKDGEIKITSIVPGSPSYRDGRLKAGDVIVKVAQGAAEPVDVSDMRLDKAIQLIRGKKGTEVRLTVKKIDGTMEVVTLIRDVIVLEDTYAQSFMIDNGNKIGYIRLPGFYADFSGGGGRDCATDVKNELLKLKDAGAKGVILDLRDNGGGSLESVVQMMGLFIKDGAVVQVKERNADPFIYRDKDPNLVYDGNLILLVNENSASASEILAAAVQDYHRGIIMGSTTTFGKGTVQRMYDMDNFVNATYAGMKPLGSVKITMQKFYRVNGGSTQLKGVTPDIVVPDAYSQIKYGEKQEDFPLKWDEIKSVDISNWQPSYVESTVENNSKKRIEGTEAFKLIQEQANEMKDQSDNTVVSLNIDKYRERQQKLKDEKKKYDELEAKFPDINISNLSVDLDHINSDSTYMARNKELLKDLKKDIYISEAGNVMTDMLKDAGTTQK